MLLISKAQYATLSKTMAQRFEDRAVAHFSRVRGVDPVATAAEPLRRGIREAIGQASIHGFNLEQPLMVFIELALDWGCGFVDDPQWPWAAVCVHAQQDQVQRARRLMQAVRERSAGRREDLLRLAAHSGRLSAAAPGGGEVQGEALATALLRSLASPPQRAGEQAGCLLEPARELVQRLGLADARALASVLLLMLAFGHRCCDDPLQGWITIHLSDRPQDDPSPGIDRLLGELTRRLERAGTPATPAEPPQRHLPGGIRLNPIGLASPLAVGPLGLSAHGGVA